jgi:hypothetical protein
MTLFKNLVSLAVFLVGAYETASIVNGKAIVNLDSDALKFEMRFSLPSKASPEKSVNPEPEKQNQALPICVLVTPVPAVQYGSAPQKTHGEGTCTVLGKISASSITPRRNRDGN